MSTYRGSDGWIYDEETGEHRRYSERDDVSGPSKKGNLVPEHTRCPNCNFRASWLRLEQRCTGCGWGDQKTAPSDGVAAAACLSMLGGSIAGFLVLTGAGWSIGGIGGALIGSGLSLAVFIAVCSTAIIVANRKPPNQDG
ncbi:MAG: hypothetical protein AB7L09_02765 [Nitrospira sp.]